MEYVDFEADTSDENANLNFLSDDENRSFTDDSSMVGGQEPSFYRKFFNQTRDPAEAVFDDDRLLLSTRNFQSEMFSIEEKDDLEFDELEGSGKCPEQFLKKPFILSR